MGKDQEFRSARCFKHRQFHLLVNHCLLQLVKAVIGLTQKTARRGLGIHIPCGLCNCQRVVVAVQRLLHLAQAIIKATNAGIRNALPCQISCKRVSKQKILVPQIHSSTCAQSQSLQKTRDHDHDQRQKKSNKPI